MTGPESDDDFINAEEDVIQDSSGRSQKKRGRPVGSRSYQKPIPPTDRVLRDRSDKSMHIAAMTIFGSNFI